MNLLSPHSIIFIIINRCLLFFFLYFFFSFFSVYFVLFFLLSFFQKASRNRCISSMNYLLSLLSFQPRSQTDAWDRRLRTLSSQTDPWDRRLRTMKDVEVPSPTQATRSVAVKTELGLFFNFFSSKSSFNSLIGFAFATDLWLYRHRCVHNLYALTSGYIAIVVYTACTHWSLAI